MLQIQKRQFSRILEIESLRGRKGKITALLLQQETELSRRECESLMKDKSATLTMEKIFSLAKFLEISPTRILDSQLLRDKFPSVVERFTPKLSQDSANIRAERNDGTHHFQAKGLARSTLLKFEDLDSVRKELEVIARNKAWIENHVLNRHASSREQKEASMYYSDIGAWSLSYHSKPVWLSWYDPDCFFEIYDHLRRVEADVDEFLRQRQSMHFSDGDNSLDDLYKRAENESKADKLELELVNREEDFRIFFHVLSRRISVTERQTADLKKIPAFDIWKKNSTYRYIFKPMILQPVFIVVPFSVEHVVLRHNATFEEVREFNVVKGQSPRFTTTELWEKQDEDFDEIFF